MSEAQERDHTMPKNILIFSDGTGQSGGVTFDEDRTNIYKLFRASRCGPDSAIDPSEQVTFYDPGLGSPRDNRFAFGWLGRKIYNLISEATGFGITANIIDCYAALIRLWTFSYLDSAVGLTLFVALGPSLQIVESQQSSQTGRR